MSTKVDLSGSHRHRREHAIAIASLMKVDTVDCGPALSLALLDGGDLLDATERRETGPDTV
jgi:hypothetical protein